MAPCRRDGRKSLTWRDYRDLLTAAHQQLIGPIVLIWDHLNVHKAPSLHDVTSSTSVDSPHVRIGRRSTRKSRCPFHTYDEAVAVRRVRQ